MYYMGLIWEYLKNYMKTRLTYRADFWVEIISDLLFQATNLIFIFVVFRHTDNLGGWSEAEVLFVYGYFMVPYGIFSCFINLWGFSERYIVKGEMDRILTRPAHNLFQILLENVDPPSLVGSFIGLIIMIFSGAEMGLVLEWWHIPALIILALSSVLIYAGIYTTLTSLSFYSDAPTGILPLMYNIQGYGRYPVTIYNRAIQVLLTWIIPFAFVGIYPAALFLERAEMHRMALLTPVMGLVFATIGLTLWNFGVKRYRGAGS
ncbi:ABC-2 type transport system permease protein [Paenibacillus polysaccharolyticus]|uniref:ABC-2 type transport system permease protein n=2 Tax=Paenibacillus TaxID=44249 RepID=A0A1G5LF49_9BACL|nr:MULTISPECIES: ABC-2 family transporter protein [Paenibacillus]MBY0206830.1 ABC-2 family transporter protein [Paenibacillus cucumis (ex Kampfer et al. 2016)]MDP9702756.1 ABC-2 type transport system permease protein [Paenibacillus intestini]SCZ10789.1 ABC-2 type transport system permease protein [Paenibacillus polysaccharolyticus]